MASTLHELPAVPDFKRFYAWQPSDRWGTAKHVGGGSGYDEYHEYTVLSRTVSPQGDTLTLVHEDRSVQIWFPPYDTIPIPMQTNTREPSRPISSTWSSRPRKFPAMPTSTIGAAVDPSLAHKPHGGTLPLRPLARLRGFLRILPLTMFPEQTQLPIRFVEGLGMTYKMFITGTGTSGYHYGTFSLDCYAQALWDSLWPCPGAYILLAAASPVEMGVSLTPWLDATRRVQGMRWEGLVPGNYQLELLDMSGRQLWHSEVFMAANGNLELPDNLPQGICLLRLSSRNGSRAVAVKVPILRN
ncbi:MAG: hypothetical protein U0176_16180 [Bacteroidia bacterium]